MKNNLRSSIKLLWNNTTIELLPSRSILIKETGELLISDIHLGKGEYYQANGIPLTNYQDLFNFKRIINLVENIKPKKLIILGDLFHSKLAISEELEYKVDSRSNLSLRASNSLNVVTPSHNCTISSVGTV